MSHESPETLPKCDGCSIHTPTPPHALTREQVAEWMFRHQNSSIARQRYRETSKTLDRQYAYDAELHGLEEKLLAHDAALRQALTQQAQRLTELETICLETYQVIGSLASDAGMFEHEATQKALDNLSQMKLVHSTVLPYPCAPTSVDQQAQEIERLKKGWESAYTLHVDDDNRLFALEQQLAASQARVRELEQPRLTLAECVVVDYLEKEVDQLLPMLGVEAALITDLSHVGDFPDDRLGAEKYVWQAAIDFLRTQLATLQATLAEREARVKELEAAHFTELKERLRYTGEYRDAKRKVEQLVTERDTARQDAARLREALQLALARPWVGIESAVEAERQQAQKALKGA